MPTSPTFDPTELSRHLDSLHRYALRAVGDPDLAADMVQETVIRALERRDQYRGDAPLLNWLLRIAHNLMVDRARRAAREIAVDEVEQQWRESEYTVAAEMVAERAAVRAELLDALARLPFIYRSAVLLHDVQDLRVADIADIHGISLPAAKQRLRRGRMAMVTALAEGAQRRTITKGVPMDCWDARRHVSDFMNGDLDDATATTVEAHLARCPTCPPLYAALVGVNDELGRLDGATDERFRDPDTVVDPSLVTRIQALIDGG
jgi:RNA polymerase sigma-70 factor (ECF subfamily)